jgi:hypothetical protein
MEIKYISAIRTDGKNSWKVLMKSKILPFVVFEDEVISLK